MNTPDLADLLKSGVHFGHKTSKRHPNMEPYIFGARQGVNIIDLQKTSSKLAEAMKVAQDLAANGKTILFVGTKKQASALVSQYASDCGMPYVDVRWLGGLLTNFQHVGDVPRKLTQLKEDKESGKHDKFTKKEQLDLTKEIEKLTGLVGGLETLMKLPDALFIVDLKEEKTALNEANQLKIPVIAMVDTNCDPIKVQYPIPANDDAIKSIDLIVGQMSAAIKEGAANPVAPVVVKEEKKDPIKQKAAKKSEKKEEVKEEKKADA